jgi:hypothetical protein
LLLTDDVIRDLLAAVPDDLLLDPHFARGAADAGAARVRYHSYLRTRLTAPRAWVGTAIGAQAEARRNPPQRKRARR